MNISRVSLLLTFTLALNACVSSSVKDKEPAEQLLAVPPADWVLTYQLNNITSRLTEFAPAQESASDFSTKLSFESFLELAHIDPIQALLTEVEQDKKRCDFVQHFNLYSGLENNYPSSVRLYFCGKKEDTENGEVKMIKAIQGNNYLYVITFVKSIESFKPNEAEIDKEEIAKWSTYLRGISLCDSQNESHACPVTTLP
jgi:hypothetical protein